ncbi:protein of unknown function [Cyanobium sp. NIES-981]|nr:protein of unknown function [Cyanobium sp. NIES-981]
MSLFCALLATLGLRRTGSELQQQRAELSAQRGLRITQRSPGQAHCGAHCPRLTFSGGPKYGWNGDSYRLLVKALSLDPPQLTFRYASLNDRVIDMCIGDPPSGSSITNACAQSAKIVNDAAADKIVEWDETSDVFDIRDPYFLFYLRWSDITDS